MSLGRDLLAWKNSKDWVIRLHSREELRRLKLLVAASQIIKTNFFF